MNWLLTIVLLVLSAVLTRYLPFSEYFRSLDTMIHEFGHALMALSLSGKVMYIELFSDRSGVTYTQLTKAWSVIPISLAGYLFASLFALFLFVMGSRRQEKWGLIVVTAVAVISLALFVRNDYGMMWLAGFIVLNLVMLIAVPRLVRDGYYLLLCFLTLEESVTGPITLVIYSLQDAAQAGDASSLGRVTVLPAIFWACLFVLFSLWCAKRAIQSFLGASKKRFSKAV